jgi:alpha/beta superfamily hydrolase
LAYLRSRYSDLPYSLAGFSFGSRIVLTLGCELGTPARIVAVGVPASHKETVGLGDCEVPRIFIQSTNDQFGPRPAMEAYFERLRGLKELIWVEAADHFFLGALDGFEETVFRVGLEVFLPTPDS